MLGFSKDEELTLHITSHPLTTHPNTSLFPLGKVREKELTPVEEKMDRLEVYTFLV